MGLILYLILLLIPVPLIRSILKYTHYRKWVFPFVALVGIYIFLIIGSIGVIYDNELFSYEYYFSILLIEVSFYIYYYFISELSKNKDTDIHWKDIECGDAWVNYGVFGLLWAWSFSLFFLYYRRHGLPVLFEISFFQYTDIYALRAEKLTNLPEGAHWYNLGFIGIPSFLILFTYILKQYGQSMKYKILFYGNLPLALLFMSFEVTKTQYIYLISYFFILNVFIQDKTINLRKVAFYVLLVFLCIVFILRIYLMDRSFYEVLKLAPVFIFKRIFVVYSEAHAYIMQIFPYRHDYFYGATFSNPGGLLPYKPVNIAQFLGWWVNSAEVQNYSLPSLSEGYANFGIIGFMLIMMIMFLQILLLQMFFKWCPKNPLFLAMFVFMAEKMLHYAIEPIQLILPEELLFFFLIAIGFYYFKNFVLAVIRNGLYGENSV